MKKLLPILFIILTCSACKKEKSGEDINPNNIIAGDTNAASNKNVQLSDTTYYEHEILLFDEFKIKVNYNYSSVMGGQQSNIRIKLLEPTNVEYVCVDSTSYIKQFLPGDNISGNVTWKAFENDGSAVLLDYAHGPLDAYSYGEWTLLSEGYIGIRVLKNNQYYYGWVKLKVVGGWFSSGLQLLGWAIYHD